MLHCKLVEDIRLQNYLKGDPHFIMQKQNSYRSPFKTVFVLSSLLSHKTCPLS